MTPTQLVEDLRSLQDETLSHKKQPIMGWTCAYIPEEIPMAFGFIPFRVRGAHISTSQAGGLMPGNNCPHVLSCLEAALHGEYNFLSGIIVANTSDAMRRLYDIWQRYIGTPFIHMLDVPKIIDGKSKEYFLQLILLLIAAIEKYFGLRLNEDSLKEAIKICNETRRLLEQLYEIKRQDGSLLTNSFLSEITNFSFSVPKPEFNRRLHNLINNLNNPSAQENHAHPNILITGSFYDQHELEDIIEDAGGRVVYEDICTRGRYYEDKIDSQKDPIEAVSERYLTRAPCARMIDSERRFNHLLAIIKRHNIAAVVYYALKFDDAYLFEFPLVREWLTEKEIPVLFLEGDHRLGHIAQLKTRIQAFLERLVPIGREI